MIKDDMKTQIPLFELPAPNKQTETAVTVKKKPSSGKERETEKAAKKFAEPTPMEKKTPKAPARTQPKTKPVSGLVPEGDVRLTANIRQDLHLKLKIEAAHRRTTIGDLIEELVEKYLHV